MNIHIVILLVMWSVLCAAQPSLPAEEIEEAVEVVHPMPYGVEGNWVLTFADDFEGDTLDTELWNDQWGAPDEYWGPPNTVRWSEEWMLPENVLVGDGLLRIRHQIQDGQITAGVITTNGKFSQRYGFFEARLRGNAVPGVLSAFWMQYDSNHWPPEIDIVEILANDWTRPRMVMHYGYPGHQSRTYRHNTDIDFTADFHVFGLEWNADEIIWYVDGEEVNRFSNPGGDFDAYPMYMQLNIHSGNGYSGYPLRNEDESFMEVDYVRAWQYRELHNDE